MAKQSDDFIFGFICQNDLEAGDGFLHMTPGVKLVGDGDDLGQRVSRFASICYMAIYPEPVRDISCSTTLPKE